MCVSDSSPVTNKTEQVFVSKKQVTIRMKTVTIFMYNGRGNCEKYAENSLANLSCLRWYKKCTFQCEDTSNFLRKLFLN
jgi:hypothetical protein